MTRSRTAWTAAGPITSECPGRRFSPDGSWEAAYDAEKRLLKLGRTGGELSPLPGVAALKYNVSLDLPEEYVPGVPGPRVAALKFHFSPDGRRLVTFHPDEKGERLVLSSWELGGARPSSVGTTTVEGSVHDLAFSADGRRLGVSVLSKTFKPVEAGSQVDQFFVFDFPSLKPLLGPVGGDLARLTGGLALDHDGGMLVVGQVGAPQLACWDVRAGKRLPGGRIRPGIVYSIDVGLRDDRVLACVSDLTITQWDARTGRRAGPTILLPGGRPSGPSPPSYSPDQTRIALTLVETVAGKSSSRVNVFSALDGDLLATISMNRYRHLPDVWFSADSKRVIVHQRGMMQEAWAWTLPTYRGPLDQVPALVRLLTGTASDPAVGFFPLPDDAIWTGPETYGRAFRAWIGLPDDSRQ